MDKLKAMQVFIKIADSGSLTAAAHALKSSLPAVVRSLAALEEELGVRLFNRTTRRILLTEEGKQYLISCRQLLAAVHEADTALSASLAEPSGQLTVTAPVLFGQMFVAPAVTRFVQRYDKVSCRVMLLDRVVNLLDEGIDVGIRIGHLHDSTLVAQKVGTIRRVVVASPAYLKRHGIPKHPKDLLQANCIRFADSAAPPWIFHDGTRKFTIPVNGNLEFNHVAPAIDACIAGIGFGMFISYQTATCIRKNKLQIVLEEFEPPVRPINIIYPHARLLPSRTRVFIEWIKQELGAIKD